MTEHRDPNDCLISDVFDEAWAARGARAAARASASIRRRRAIRRGSMLCGAACVVFALVLSLKRPDPEVTVAATVPLLEIISDRELLELLKDRQFVASRGGDGKIREVIFFDDTADREHPVRH